MSIDSHQPTTPSLHFIARLLAASAAAFGLLAILGWSLNLPFLSSLLPGALSISPDAAFSLAFSAAALLLALQSALPSSPIPHTASPSFVLRTPHSSSASIPSVVGHRSSVGRTPHSALAYACLALAVLVALLALSRHFTPLNFTLDLLFPPALPLDSLSPHSSLIFILDALALLLLLSPLSTPYSPRAYLAAQVISLVTGFLALLALTHYALDTAPLAILSPQSSVLSPDIPPPTALGLLLLSAALLLFRPGHGFVSLIASSNPAGALARRLSLAAIAIPVGLIVTIGAGFHLGLYSQRVSASLILALAVLAFLSLICISAASLNHSLIARAHADAALRKRVSLYRAILDDRSESIARLLPDASITYVNLAFARRHGLRPDKLIGRSLLSLPYISQQERDELQARLSCLTWEHPLASVDTRSPLPSGEWKWFQWSLRAIFDERQAFLEFQIVGVDITDRKLIEEQLAHQAFHDALTGLPNRVLFRDRLSHALARARRNSTSIAVLFLDLDNFKVINDSLGHKVGDQLLAVVSRRLQECVRAEDTIARLGGDEFTVLLEDITDFHTAVSIAERIGKELQLPVPIDIPNPTSPLTTSPLTSSPNPQSGYPLGDRNPQSSDPLSPQSSRTKDVTLSPTVARQVFISSSIGIAMQSSAYETPEDLLRNADIAMYEAKSKGKSRYEIFERSMTSRFTEHLELETDLRRALDRGEFKVYYQPIVKLGNGRITEVEALIRWEHPERRLVAPADFIPAAEQSGLIVPIGQWVLEQACKQTLEWQKQFPRDPHEPPLGVSVNLSARQFQHPHLIDEIAQVVRDTGLDPRFLKLEITESIGIDDVNSASATLWKLKDLGLRLALDDFGTGYSALSYLKNFPFDTLKLDRAFVDGLGVDPEDTAIVHAAIAFAKALGLSVTAEGIENKEQILELQKLGCDHGQGYYFARPMTAAAIAVLLANPPWIRAGKTMEFHPSIRLAAGMVTAD